jgi:methylmalonyl-CoA mutase
MEGTAELEWGLHFSSPWPKFVTSESVKTTPQNPAEPVAAEHAREAEAWRAKVEQELKGAEYQRTLVRKTIDGLPLQPVYANCNEEECDPEFDGCVEQALHSMPGDAPYIRGRRAAQGKRAWTIMVAVDLSDSEANAKLLEDLEGGADGVWLWAKSESDLKALPSALAGVKPGAVNWLLTTPGTRGGKLGGKLRQAFEAWIAAGGASLDQVGLHWPEDGLDTLRHHMAGATESQELAIAMAMLVELLRTAEEDGRDLEQEVERLVMRFGIARDTFLEIAKLRAARGLSRRIFEACDLADAPIPAIHAVTSPRTLARRDPWVNMLRSTTQCFAAILGGAEAITAMPFDSIPGPASKLGRRVARNTQLILDEECHLGDVLDAGGGAYSIENYTRLLAEQAWTGFQEIEKLGGLSAVEASGWLDDWLQQSHGERRAQIRKRKMPITGVSEYANLEEELPESMKSESTNDNAEISKACDPMNDKQSKSDLGGKTSAKCGSGMAHYRDAEEFEALRDWADGWKNQHGAAPTVFVLTLGDASQFGPRLDFVRNFFASGGWQIVIGGTVAEFAASGAIAACMCGLDDNYEEMGELAAPQLMMSGALRLFHAGKGVDGIYVGCDAWQTLSDLKDLYQSSIEDSAGDSASSEGSPCSGDSANPEGK